MQDRLQFIKDQVVQARQDIWDKTEIYWWEEKLSKQKHKQMVEMEDKCRKMAKLLKYHQAGKVGNEPTKPTAVYDQSELDRLKAEIAKLEQDKKA